MLKVITLFTGIGAQEAALKRLGIPYKVTGISEIDKYAIQSYEAMNGPTRNYGDITQIPYLDYADLWTYSSPCQDFSTAGKQKGIYNADGSLTRSGLLKHVERLLETSVMLGNQPKYLLLENVKGLVSKKFMPDFQRWLDKLEQLGYNNYWQVLNAKDYGIPQNRERVFVVSIRKDVDTKGYKFPSPVPLEKRLKDMLEPCVDEKYYLSADKVEKLTSQIKIKEISNTVRCGGGGSLDGKHTWDIVVEPLCAASRGRNPENPSDRTAGIPTEQRLEINNTGCSNTLTSVQKDNYVIEPFIADDTQGFDGVRYYNNYSPTLRSERSGLKVIKPKRELKFKIKPNGDIRGYQNDSKNSSASEWQIYNENNISGVITTTHAPKVIQLGNIVNSGNWNNPQRGRIYSPSGISPALNTVGGGGLEPKILEEGVGLNPLSRKLEFNGFKENSPSLRATDYKCPHCYSDGYRIRKLTAKEYWRLMGFTDIEFECAQISGVSNSQLYRQAGNSIVVDVLSAIFKELLK